MTKKQSILLMVFLMLVIGVIVLGCGYKGCTLIEPENIEMHNVLVEFTNAVDRGDFPAAFSFLTREAQSKIDYEKFSSTPHDFEGVVAAFRHAGITMRNKRSKDEPSQYVDKMYGHEGVIKFIPVLEEGKWRIANVYADYPKLPD